MDKPPLPYGVLVSASSPPVWCGCMSQRSLATVKAWPTSIWKAHLIAHHPGSLKWVSQAKRFSFEAFAGLGTIRKLQRGTSLHLSSSDSPSYSLVWGPRSPSPDSWTRADPFSGCLPPGPSCCPTWLSLLRNPYCLSALPTTRKQVQFCCNLMSPLQHG